MARRPELTPIEPDILNWDNDINKNLLILGLNNFPMRLPFHIGDETDLATILRPTRFAYCIILVDDTTNGWSIYLSNGTTWNRLTGLDIPTTPVPQTYERHNLTQLENGDFNFTGLFGIFGDNYENLGSLNSPFVLPVHAGDETNLETIFPASNWQHCCILVYDTSFSASFYTSDGIIWKRQF